MENIQRDLEKELSRASERKSEKRRKEWTLLMVGEDGEVKRSGRILARVTLYRNLLLFCMVLVVPLAWYGWNAYHGNASLKEQIRTLEAENRDLKERNDLLTAELVMAEQGSGKNFDVFQLDEGDLLGKNEKSSVISQGEAPGVGKKVVEASAGSGIVKSDLKAQDSGNVSPISVSVEKFSAAEISPKKLLKVQFVIRNNTPGSKTVSGRIFVRLKGDDNLTVVEPATVFKEGLPGDPGRGQLFSIARYKTVFFKFKNLERPEIFDSAEIFVFSVKGELIYNKTISLALKSGDSA